jgi:hypothetical protein
MRFLCRGRVFSDTENTALADAQLITGADYARGERLPERGPVVTSEEWRGDVCPVPAGHAGRVSR